jgi:hypothetical protein
MSVHPLLLINPDSSVLISSWVERQGRGGVDPGLRHLLAQTQETISRESMAVASDLTSSAMGLPTIGPEVDLGAIVTSVYDRWFADLPMPASAWARNAPQRRTRAIRFGCYRRGDASIRIHPRLGRPWIAQAFLEHVVYHELCHHRQACMPLVRRERVHGPRFRAWEQAFPDHHAAIAWERLALPWLLSDTPPPWHTLT